MKRLPLYDYTTGTLDQHSQALMAKLASGTRLSLAVTDANSEFMPRKFGPMQGTVQTLAQLPMQRCYQSDPDTRLKKLYKLEVEDGYVKKADWYKLFEEAFVIPGGGS